MDVFIVASCRAEERVERRRDDALLGG